MGSGFGFGVSGFSCLRFYGLGSKVLVGGFQVLVFRRRVGFRASRVKAFDHFGIGWQFKQFAALSTNLKFLPLW